MVTTDRDVENVEQAPIDRKNLRFTSLRVGNWRNFTNFSVELRPRMFLVGPNASGKSNFLDCFRFLSDIVSVGGGFEAAVAKRGGVSTLRALAARRYSSISLRVTIGNDSVPDEWTYELQFKQDNNRRPEIESEVVKYRGRSIIERPDSEDESDPERKKQTHLEQVNVNRKFRTVADFFASLNYLHIVPQLVREPDRSVGKKNDPFGGDFLEQIARTTVKTREARLRKIVKALTVAVPQLQELKLEPDVRGVPHLKGKYQHWRPNGAWQDESHFSDGTLRLLGLLWSVTESKGPLLLEEPELSLHPEVVRFIPQMFARVQRRSTRQILVSSHSTEILSDPGIGSNEVLVLTPKNEGTSVHVLSEMEDIQALVEAGVPLGDVLRKSTAPQDAGQISFFGG
ncbi:AAA family ATPase [Streptomyces sp. CNQ-509]|uniref:AAA family ATPase n=1 Tax=Streptomyces sp. CNQ-509 TaxID=444103 RepID=UPI00099E10B0|nr:ATP-binding protein [Streptomyces sp. CNQ-509]